MYFSKTFSKWSLQQIHTGINHRAWGAGVNLPAWNPFSIPAPQAQLPTELPKSGNPWLPHSLLSPEPKDICFICQNPKWFAGIYAGNALNTFLSLVTDFRVQGLSFGSERRISSFRISDPAPPHWHSPTLCSPGLTHILQQEFPAPKENNSKPNPPEAASERGQEAARSWLWADCCSHSSSSGLRHFTELSAEVSSGSFPPFSSLFSLLISQFGAEQLQTPPGCVPALLQPLKCRIWLCTEFEANIELLHANLNISNDPCSAGGSWEQGQAGRGWRTGISLPNHHISLCSSSIPAWEGVRIQG